jgi:hypothetical protein
LTDDSKDKPPDSGKKRTVGYQLTVRTFTGKFRRWKKKDTRLIKAGHEIFFLVISVCSNAAAAASTLIGNGMMAA